MNEIEMGPDLTPARHRHVTVIVAVVLALLVGSVAVIAGRNGARSHAGLPLLPAASAASTASPSSAASLGLTGAEPAVAQMYMQPISYRLRVTLPALTTQAPAYRLDSGLTEAAVARLARALGLRTSVTTQADGWSVTDGAHFLHVSGDNGGQWYYNASGGNSCIGISAPVARSGGSNGGSGRGFACSSGVVGIGTQANGVVAPAPNVTAKSVPVQDSSAATANGSQPASVPPAQAPQKAPAACEVPLCPAGSACPNSCARPGPGPGPVPPPAPEPRPVDLPSSQQAAQAVRDLLAKAGADTRGADVKVVLQPNADLVTVNPAVGGLPTTGMAYSVTLGVKGLVEFASGVLAGETKLGDYPLVGTAQGFKRLQSGQWLFSGGIQPMAPMAGAAGKAGAAGAPPVTPSRLVTVTGVHLALIRVFGADRKSDLAPAYVFETSLAYLNPAVPAVADRLLQIAPAGEPGIITPRPAPAATGAPQPAGPPVNGAPVPTASPRSP